MGLCVADQGLCCLLKVLVSLCIRLYVADQDLCCLLIYGQVRGGLVTVWVCMWLIRVFGVCIYMDNLGPGQSLHGSVYG